MSGKRKYFKYNECKEKDVLVAAGTYVGSEEGKFGVQHVFRQKDGDIVVLNSAGHLNFLLENHVQVGSICNVIYAGKVRLTRGAMAGKDAHNFEVEVADQVSAPTKVVAATAAEVLAESGDDITL